MITARDIFFIAPLAAFLSGYLLFTCLAPNKQTATPDLITLELPKALRCASESQLNIRILKEQEDSTLPDGTVIDQVPVAHTVVKPQQTIWVTLTKKPPVQKINYIGKTASEIQALATQQSIQAAVHHIPDFYGNGTCVAQNPSPQDPLIDKKLTCYVTKKPKLCFVTPHFIARNLKEIRAAFECEHVTIDVLYASPDLANKDEELLFVTDQRPLPGHQCRGAEGLYLQLFVDTKKV
jgi:beta-lactam-binding protein with PASTA domain